MEEEEEDRVALSLQRLSQVVEATLRRILEVALIVVLPLRLAVLLGKVVVVVETTLRRILEEEVGTVV